MSGSSRLHNHDFACLTDYAVLGYCNTTMSVESGSGEGFKFKQRWRRPSFKSAGGAEGSQAADESQETTAADTGSDQGGFEAQAEAGPTNEADQERVKADQTASDEAAQPEAETGLTEEQYRDIIVDFQHSMLNIYGPAWQQLLETLSSEDVMAINKYKKWAAEDGSVDTFIKRQAEAGPVNRQTVATELSRLTDLMDAFITGEGRTSDETEPPVAAEARAVLRSAYDFITTLSESDIQTLVNNGSIDQAAAANFRTMGEFTSVDAFIASEFSQSKNNLGKAATADAVWAHLLSEVSPFPEWIKKIERELGRTTKSDAASQNESAAEKEPKAETNEQAAIDMGQAFLDAVEAGGDTLFDRMVAGGESRVVITRVRNLYKSLKEDTPEGFIQKSLKRQAELGQDSAAAMALLLTQIETMTALVERYPAESTAAEGDELPRQRGIVREMLTPYYDFAKGLSESDFKLLQAGGVSQGSIDVLRNIKATGSINEFILSEYELTKEALVAKGVDPVDELSVWEQLAEDNSFATELDEFNEILEAQREKGRRTERSSNRAENYAYELAALVKNFDDDLFEQMKHDGVPDSDILLIKTYKGQFGPGHQDEFVRKQLLLRAGRATVVDVAEEFEAELQRLLPIARKYGQQNEASEPNEAEEYRQRAETVLADLRREVLKLTMTELKMLRDKDATAARHMVWIEEAWSQHALSVEVELASKFDDIKRATGQPDARVWQILAQRYEEALSVVSAFMRENATGPQPDAEPRAREDEVNTQESEREAAARRQVLIDLLLRMGKTPEQAAEAVKGIDLSGSDYEVMVSIMLRSASEGLLARPLLETILAQPASLAEQTIRRKLENIPTDSSQAFSELMTCYMGARVRKDDLPSYLPLGNEILSALTEFMRNNVSADVQAHLNKLSGAELSELLIRALIEFQQRNGERSWNAFQAQLREILAETPPATPTPPASATPSPTAPPALTPEDFRTYLRGNTEVRMPDEQWNDVDFRRRVIGSQLKTMLRRAELHQLDTGLLKALKQATDRDEDPEKFWQLLDDEMNRSNPPQANLISVMMGMINELSRAGVSVSEEPRMAERLDVAQYEAQQRESEAAYIEAVEVAQAALVFEMGILWKHLTSEEKQGVLSVDRPRSHLVKHGNLDNYLEERRAKEAEIQSNKPDGRRLGARGQAALIKEELERSRQNLVDTINRRNPGLAGTLSLSDEINERMAGQFNGRWGQSEKPTGEVTMRPEEAQGVAELTDDVIKVLAKKQSTPAQQTKMNEVLTAVAQLSRDGTTAERATVLQKLLDDKKLDRSSYEQALNGQVVSRDRYRVGNDIVLELVRDNMGKTAVGIANAKFDAVAEDVLVATDGLIERQHMTELDGANLLQDRLGFGDSLVVYVQTSNEDQSRRGGTAYEISKDGQGQWRILGTDTTGNKPQLIELPLSEKQVADLKFKPDTYLSLVPGKPPVHIESFSLVYTNTRSLAKNKEMAKNIASIRKPLGVKSVNIGKTLEQQYSKLPWATRAKRSLIHYVREG